MTGWREDEKKRNRSGGRERYGQKSKMVIKKTRTENSLGHSR